MVLYIPDTFTTIMRERLNRVSMGVYFRLALEPEPLRVWMGVMDFPTKRVMIDGTVNDVTDFGYPSTDPAGELYYGMGNLIGMPDIEISIDGSAPRLQIQLSGILPAHVAMIDEGAESVAGCEARIGIAPMDEYHQPLHPIISLQTLYADLIDFEQVAGEKFDAPRTQTVSLSLGAGNGRRAVPKLTSWTHAQHQVLHPGDDFFKMQGRYIQGLKISWPPA